MTNRIVILTGDELRHRYMRKALSQSQDISVPESYCESPEAGMENILHAQDHEHELRSAYIRAREQSERDFFGHFVGICRDYSNPVRIARGDINSEEIAERIKGLQPDLLVAYGCSLISSSLLTHYQGRIINIHLGLSPYYRGSATNYWPLVDGKPEYVGVTFMKMDAGIDTGEVIHQVRPRIYASDTPHQVGNRLIADTAQVAAKVIGCFSEMKPIKQIPEPDGFRLCKRNDFTEDSVARLHANIKDNMFPRYLQEKARRDSLVPVIEHPLLADGGTT